MSMEKERSLKKTETPAPAFRSMLTVLLCVLLAFSAAACGNSGSSGTSTSSKEDSVGKQYLAAFENSTSDDPEEIAKELIAVDESMNLTLRYIEGGYMDGFGEEEVYDFNYGFEVAPKSGNSCFAGYVLQSDTPETLLEVLKTNVDLSWNDGKGADEMVYEIRGDLVFFLICSNAG